MLWCHLAICAVVIVASDLRLHKIRRRDILLSVVTFLPLVSMSALVHALANYSFFRLLHRITSRAIGYGDVRLSFVIGLYSGSFFSSVQALAIINIYTWLSSGIYVLVKVSWDRTSTKSRIPFAPFMFLGLVIALMTAR